MKVSGKIAERAVIVTTSHRGVFFGYATDTEGDSIKLRAARMCVYWSADMHGVFGLASSGPSESCKIGPPVDFTVRDITGVMEVTIGAVAKWEAASWR